MATPRASRFASGLEPFDEAENDRYEFVRFDGFDDVHLEAGFQSADAGIPEKCDRPRQQIEETKLGC